MPITTSILLDTNILLRTQFDKTVHITNATRAVVELRRRGERLATTIQNLAEFWNVSTRPEGDNGYGLSLLETYQRLNYFERSFDILPESHLSFLVWRKLVMEQQVKGKQVHDARIASVMLAASIDRIVTFNTKDFMRFPELKVLHPDEVLAGA